MERRIERIGLAQLATLSDAQKATLVQRLQTLAHVADRLAADAQRAREDQ
ncbi:MAG: hypothetical protein OXU75_03180 [Deltaproteobacteria bacterium]|nr:hypothetical protein [Deltaproteobacteria bacterium]